MADAGRARFHQADGEILALHDISGGRMVMGIGRGDSARRYIGQPPVRVAEFERRLAMIKPLIWVRSDAAVAASEP